MSSPFHETFFVETNVPTRSRIERTKKEKKGNKKLGANLENAAATP